MMLREAIHRMVRAGNVEAVLDEACRTLVEHGFLAAGAGLDEEAPGRVRIYAGLAGTAITEESIARALTSTRPEVAGTTAAVALRDGDRALGMLVVVATNATAFDSEAIAAFGDIAAVVTCAATRHRMRSDRDHARDALRETTTRLSTLLDHFPDLIARFDREGRHLYCNPAVEQAFGLTLADILGKTPLEVPGIAPEMGSILLAAIRRAIAERQQNTLEVEMTALHGRRTYEIRHVPELDMAGEVTGVLGIARDTTERKHAESELLERESAYRSLAENTPDMITRWDRDLKRLYVNRAFAEMLRRPADQIIGTRIGEDYSGEVKRVVGANVQLMKRLIEQVFATGEPTSMDIPIPTQRGVGVSNLRLVPERDATGTVRSVLGIGRDVTAIMESEREARTLSDGSPDFISRFDAQGCFRFVNKAVISVISQPAEQLLGRHVREVLVGNPHLEEVGSIIETALRDGQPVETELDIPIQGELRAFNVRVHPERDYEGTLVSVLLVSRDITERRALEQQLRQAQKMEAVGQLAGGIAHDFNNMMAAIVMQASLASRPHATPNAVRDALRAITDTTEHTARLTQQLLTFSRRQTARLVQMDLRELVASASNLLRRVLGEHISIEVRLPGSLPQARVDPSMIEQVLMNLGINARDAMPDGGMLVIALGAVEIRPEDVSQHPGSKPGKYVCVAVTDTGSGIDPTDIPRIFDPFFTTKEVGKGTGLGLATVFGIVQQHDGWIEVDTKPRHGSTFRVYLRANDAVAATCESPQATDPIVGGNETIMLVEDEASVRSAVRQVLEEYGYRVLEAESAVAALTRWNSGEQDIQLLLTDLIMPGGISGLQLAERMREKLPGLKVIFMSGYGAAHATSLMQQPERTFLQKPFAPELLIASVRRCLDGAH